MIALLQRVTQAKVEVDQQVVGQIGQGLLVLLGVEKDDSPADVARMADRVANYRMFADSDDKTNLSLRDIQGQALVVSQFTLAADTAKGRRPSFSSAAAPEQAEALYEDFVAAMKALDIPTETGQFGADMAVSLTNDGPVTFSLRSR